MTYSKTLVVLAKSIKKGGFCIAGKDMSDFSWVRPVKESPFSYNDLCNFSNRSNPIKVFDIVEMSFIEKTPKTFQPENELVDMNIKWSFIEEFGIENLDSLINRNEYDLLDKYKVSSFSESNIKTLNILNSLQLIKISSSNNAKISYKSINFYSVNKYQPRLIFDYKGKNYNLPITDSNFPKSDSFISPITLKNAYITIGIGEEYYGFHYILVVMINKIELP